MIYADYNYYTDSYGGTAISEEEFSRLAAKASAYIDRVTVGRASEHYDDDRLKCCLCDLAETLLSCGVSGSVMTSETVGSWSCTFSSDKDTEALMLSKCRTWLPSDWLYRGVSRE